MKLEHMPERKTNYSYAIFWFAMGAVLAGMLWFFWRKEWILERRRLSIVDSCSLWTRILEDLE